MEFLFNNTKYKIVRSILFIVFLTLSTLGYSQSVPASPSALTVTPLSGGTQVILRWTDNSSDETGFEVERSSVSGTGYTLIATTAINGVSYVNSGLTTVTQYYYRVRAVNANGSSSYSSEVAVTTLPATPNAPMNLVATPNSPTQITLTWVDVSGNETGFQIERALGAGSFSVIATTAADVTTFIDAGLTASTQYRYKMRAVNLTVFSSYTSIVSPTTPATPPIAPSSLSGTAANEMQVNLTWLDNSNNETHFQIERSLTSGSGFVVVTNIGANSTSYNNTGLTADTQYYYRVRAVNAGGNSAYTPEFNIATPPPTPSAPFGINYNARTSTQIGLTWTDNSTNETGFQIERSLNSVSGFALVATTAANATSYSDTGLTSSTMYYYRIRAVNSTVFSAYTSTLGVSTLVGPPAAPSVLAASASSSTQVNLTWTDNSTNETGFEIERSLTSGSGFVLINTTSVNVTSYANTSLTASTQYYYRVRAINAGGNSAYSAEVAINTPPPTPSAPSSLSSTSQGSTQIALTWTDNSTNETGFQIERSLSSSSGFTLVTTTAANVTTYSDTGLNPSTLYYYRVRAVNSIVFSPYTSAVGVNTLVAPPAAPSILAGSAASSTQVNLTWTDNSTNETGFEIERSSTSGSGFVLITTTSSNVTSYANTSLTASTQYYYRVRAKNAGGNSAYTSEFGIATLPPTPSAPSSLSSTSQGSTQIALTWTDNSTNETGFQIERSLTSSSGFTLVTTTAANVTTYSDTGLNPSTLYYYRVRAVNSIVFSPYTLTFGVSTLVGPPATPSALAASASSATQVNLTWTDNSTNETGFEIERSLTSGSGFVLITTTSSNVTSYANTSLTASTQYYYRVRAINAAGNSAYSTEVTVTTLPPTPSAPSGLTATQGSTQIGLTWTDNSNNETGFQIERSSASGGPFTLITTTAANVTSYTNTGLTASTLYYYRIRAVNSIVFSAYTSEVGVNTLVAPPAAPSVLAASASSSTQVNLTWTDNATNETGFELERSLTSGSGFALITTIAFPNVTSYANTGLTASTTYYYRVRAINAGGNSVYSTEVTVTTLPPTPSAPSGLTATQGSTQIGLTWTDNSTNETGFQIERSSASGGPFTLITTTAANVTSYTNTGLTASTLYYYRIRAVNSIVFSAYTSEVGVNTLVAPPAAPSVLAGSAASSTQVNLTWTDNSTNETGFEIERSLTSGSGFVLITTTSSNVTSYANTSLTASTQYYYRVRAINAGGNSAYSTEVNVTTLPPTPSAPSSLSFATRGSTQIGLTWTDNSNNETGFQIERSLSSGSGFTLITTTAANVTSYTNTGLNASTLYYYRIRAVNTTVFSPYTTELAVNTLVAPPVAPSVLAASASSSTQVNLTWTDNSSNETGFEIERSLTSGSGFVLITTTSPNVTTYANTSLTASTQYYYRVRAINAGGNSSYSTEVNVTTLPATPTGLTVTAVSQTQINVSWNGNALNITGYQLERSLTSVNGFAAIATTAANVTSFVNTGLTSATKYYYRIRAVNSGLLSSYSAEVTATTWVDVPVKPSALKATPFSATRIDLTWADNSGNETGFELERSTTSGSGFSLVVTRPTNTGSYSDVNLSPNTKYYYRIRAISSVGNSTYTTESNATTPEMLPLAPSALTLQMASNTRINLQWNDGSTNETGFQIERRTSSGTFATVATTLANQTSYNDDGLQSGTLYYYRIRSTNSGGSSSYTAEQSATTLTIQQHVVNNLTFQYQYDQRERITGKKIPGADWVYMVYDNLDRLVMAQDGEQRKLNKWSYTKYDALNRPIITGIYTHTVATDQAAMAGLLSKTTFNESYNGDNTTHGYTNTVFPVSNFAPTNFEPLIVNYYDDYKFTDNWSGYSYITDGLTATAYSQSYSQPITGSENKNVLGYITGSKTKVLEGLSGNTWLKSIIYYDDKYNVIQTQADNYKGAKDQTSNLYDFNGKLLKSKTTHNITSTPKTVTRSFSYDHTGRLKKTWHAVNQDTPVLLSSNEYNEFGQVIDKKLHSTDNGTNFKQSIDYTYNIRKWLTSINGTNTTEPDYFNLILKYNKPTSNGGEKQYNGNVSEVLWKSPDGRENSYGYFYDALNRLKEAKYYDISMPINNGRFNEKIWDEVNGKSGYDLNGNIKFLSRAGKTGIDVAGITTYGQLDNLTYTYVGNQLQKVTDSSVKTEGFVDGLNTDDDYFYDANGSITVDKNKSIDGTGNSKISYNYLNLPEKVVKNTGETIKYTYDASGQKLRQEVFSTTNSLIKKTDYIGDFFYENDVLKFINNEEGRVVVSGSQNEYQYHLKDHLGNVRVTFTTKEEIDPNVATLEASNLTNENSKFLRRDRVRLVNNPWFDHTNNATGSNGGAVRLSGNANEKTGLVRSISVMPGDVIKAEVYAKYIDTNPSNWTAALSTLLGQLAGGTAAAGTVVDGSLYATNSSNPFTLLGMNNTAASTGPGPKAYLNYLVFDRDYKFKTGGYKRLSDVPKESGNNVNHEKLEVQFDITEAGFVYVYLSNEETSPLDVYYDDFQVEQIKSPIIAYQDYYPFGLTFNSYTRENSVKQDYLYNGKELQDELGLGWLDYGARMYMPDIGRWGTVDPHSESYPSVSPFTYVYNNPTNFVDPDGRDGVVSGSGTASDPYVIKANYYYYNLTAEQIKALQDAIAQYNNNGVAFKIKTDNGEIYVAFNLSTADGGDQDKAEDMALGDSETIEGAQYFFGNVVTAGDVEDKDGKTSFGEANNLTITLDENSINDALLSNPGGNVEDMRRGSMVHEIGHNLGGNHGDPGGIMDPVSANEVRKDGCMGDCGTGVYNYHVPTVDKNGVRAIAGRINAQYKTAESPYLTKKENANVIKEKGVTTGRTKTK